MLDKAIHRMDVDKALWLAYSLQEQMLSNWYMPLWRLERNGWLIVRAGCNQALSTADHIHTLGFNSSEYDNTHLLAREGWIVSIDFTYGDKLPVSLLVIPDYREKEVGQHLHSGATRVIVPQVKERIIKF